MSFFHSMAFAALASLPAAAIAQEKTHQTDPANPLAAVPAAVYESAISNYRPFSAPKESPAKGWRAVNDEMGRLGGHMGQLKDAPAQKEPAPPVPAAASTPAADKAPSQPMPSSHDLHRKAKGK